MARQLLGETLRRAAGRDPARRFHQLYDKLYRPDILGRAFERACARGGRPPDYSRARLESVGERLHSGAFRPRGGDFSDRVVEEALALVLEPVLLPVRSFDAWGIVGAVRDLVGRSRGPVSSFTVLPDWTLFPGGILDLLELRIADRKVLALVRAFLAASLSPAALDFGPLHVPRLGGGLGPLLAEYQLAAWEQGLAWPAVRGGNEVVLAGDYPGYPGHPQGRVTRVGTDPAGGGILVSAVRPADGFDFLGFSWRKRPQTGEAVFRPGEAGVRAIRSRIREITRGKTHLDLATMVERVNRPLAEWGAYYRICPHRDGMRKIDGYVRERLAIFNARKHGLSGPGLGRPEVSRAALRALGLIELGKLPQAGTEEF